MKMRGFKLFTAVLTATMLSVTAAIPVAAYPNTAGHWTQSGGKWYFLDEQGNTVYGWIYDNNSWYYFSPRWGGLAQRLAGASGRKTVLLQHEA